MTLRLLGRLLAPLVLAGAIFSLAAAAQTPGQPVVIEVAGNSIMLAAADADAFQRRLNRPPHLGTPPAAQPPSFPVITRYWRVAAKDDEAVAPAAEAEYFPQGGFVRARRDGEDVWLVLDLRQRAILDSYIRYGLESDRPAARPGALLITIFAAQREPVGIEAGRLSFGDAEARAFWDAVAPAAAAPVFNEPPEPPGGEDAPGYWLTFALPEGRAQQYFVNPVNGSLTDALGAETYDVRALIGGVLPATANASLIAQDEPAGSQAWWLLALAGGATLIALASWRRRLNVA